MKNTGKPCFEDCFSASIQLYAQYSEWVPRIGRAAIWAIALPRRKQERLCTKEVKDEDAPQHSGTPVYADRSFVFRANARLVPVLTDAPERPQRGLGCGTRTARII